MWTDAKKSEVILPIVDGGEIIRNSTWDLEDATQRTKLQQLLDDGAYVEGGMPGADKIDFSLSGCCGNVVNDKAKVTVIYAMIVKPAGSADATANPASCWLPGPARFDFQGITSGAPRPSPPNDKINDLVIEGNILPVNSGLAYKWEMDAAVGTLTNEETANPIHSPPATAGTGYITLKVFHNGEDTGVFEKKKIEIFEDCLERDYNNFGTGGSCGDNLTGAGFTFARYGVTATTNNVFNCHGSVIHAYDGSGSGYSDSTIDVRGWSTILSTNPNSVDWYYIEQDLTFRGRGVIVSFWREDPRTKLPQAQHSHTSYFRTAMWGANNENAFAMSPDGPVATWQWDICGSREYYQDTLDYYAAHNYAKPIEWIRVHYPPPTP